MITIFSFIPKNYIKYDNDDNPSISLFSSIKTSILNQTYTNWELLLLTNVENVLLNLNGENINNDCQYPNNDIKIKIVYILLHNSERKFKPLLSIILKSLLKMNNPFSIFLLILYIITL